MINNLPTELLHIIAGYLDSKDLFQLMSSSKRLHDILQKALYAEVVVYRRGDSVKSAKAVRSFFSAIFGKPVLATYVHSMTLGYPKDDVKEGQAEVDGKPLLQIVPQLVIERNEYSEAEKTKWLEDFQRGDASEPWIALLIPQMKELRKLTIEWPDVSDYVADCLRKLSMAPEPAFPHLQEVYSTSYDGTESANPSYYMDAFFRMPSVRKIGCYAMGEIFEQEEDELELGYDEDYEDFFSDSELNDPWSIVNRKRDALLSQSSNITDLDLSTVNAGNGMQVWIQTCKALKSFRLTHSMIVGPGNEYNPKKIYKALSFHKQTLESLWVEPDYGSMTDEDVEWMGSFVDFTTLKTICLPFFNLVEFDKNSEPMCRLRDVLPCSLKTLYLILDNEESFIEAMNQLVDLANCENFWELTTIHFEYYLLSGTDQEVKLEWAKQRCEATGKSFSVHFSKGWFYGHEKPTSWVFGPANEATLAIMYG